MNNQTIVCCVVALVLGMLLANMLKNVCGCKLTEGQGNVECRTNAMQYIPHDQCFTAQHVNEVCDLNCRGATCEAARRRFSRARKGEKSGRCERRTDSQQSPGWELSQTRDECEMKGGQWECYN